MGKMASIPILPINLDAMLNFDGDFDGHGIGMCKQTFSVEKTGGNLRWVKCGSFRMMNHKKREC